MGIKIKLLIKRNGITALLIPFSNKKPSCPKTGKVKIKTKIIENIFFIKKGFYKVNEI
jgi:hypothetical protein